LQLLFLRKLLLQQTHCAYASPFIIVANKPPADDPLVNILYWDIIWIICEYLSYADLFAFRWTSRIISARVLVVLERRLTPGSEGNIKLKTCVGGHGLFPLWLLIEGDEFRDSLRSITISENLNSIDYGSMNPVADLFDPAAGLDIKVEILGFPTEHAKRLLIQIIAHLRNLNAQDVASGRLYTPNLISIYFHTRYFRRNALCCK
jgi:hypothetical protein